ncbi:MAG: hypothetical protein R3F62_24245 [Planctomycetota bacterium]
MALRRNSNKSGTGKRATGKRATGGKDRTLPPSYPKGGGKDRTLPPNYPKGGKRATGGKRTTGRRASATQTREPSDEDSLFEELEESGEEAAASQEASGEAVVSREGRARFTPPVPWLPEHGKPLQLDATDRAVRQIVGGLREGCGQCRYRRICAFAPAKLQIELQSKPRTRHRHARFLGQGLQKLSKVKGDWISSLIRMLTGREKDALLAGCLLSEAWRDRPTDALRLAGYALEACGVDALKEALSARSSVSEAPQEGGIDPRQLIQRMFRGQVLRILAFSPHENVLKDMQGLLVLDADEEDRLFQYEAVAALALLIGRRMSGTAWIKSLERDAPGPFRATFATRDPGNGAIDVFFPYRRGKKRSYLYLRRDRDLNERLSSIDKVRIDSLLYRVFLVFRTDPMKTHRIFKELCRHLNVRAGKYNANHVLAGFERLERDDLLLLGIYAPALARAVGYYLEIEEFHELVKFLYSLRSESGRRGEATIPAHEKVFEQRHEWEELVWDLSPDLIKDVFSVLFRLNASYKKRVYTSPTYLKIGEVAYLLTALSGWNARGLEVELKQLRKPLAFVAYGLQPPGKWSRIRVGKLARAKERAERKSRDDVARACEQGQRYMALMHGTRDFAELQRLAGDPDWEPPEHAPSRVGRLSQVDPDDFSDFEDSEDGAGLADVDPHVSTDGELFIFVADDETNEAGEILDKHGRPSQMGRVSDMGTLSDMQPVDEDARRSSRRRRVVNPNEAPLSGSGLIEIDDSREAPRGKSGRRAVSEDDLFVDSQGELDAIDRDFGDDDPFGAPPPRPRRPERPRGLSESLSDLDDLFEDAPEPESREQSPFSDSGELDDLDDWDDL